MVRVTAGVCAAGLAVLARATAIGHAQLPAPQSPFMLGLLDSTGRLTPLFRYADGNWTAPWQYEPPNPPATLAAIPQSWWPGFSSRDWSVVLPAKRSLVLSGMAKPVDRCSGYRGTTDIQTSFVDRATANGAATVAVAGPVDVHAVDTADLNAGADNLFWRDANQRLRDWLRKLDRSGKQIKLDEAARIPRRSGGPVWELQAWVDERFVRLWFADGPNPFVIFADDGNDEMTARFINPIAAVWLTHKYGQSELLILARYTFYDGGEFAMFRVTSEGVTPVITGAGQGC